MANLTKKQEAFCQGIAKYGRKAKVKAYTKAGYSMNMSPASLKAEADKKYNTPNLSLRIDELIKAVEKIAKEKFTITIEQRLKWLKDIHDAGMNQQTIIKGESSVNQRENLAASNAAIKTMNEMLGVNELTEGAKPVKVLIGVRDASRP